MNICIAAAEVAPFAKTGGLGDVTAALARYLHRAGHDVRVFLPRYAAIDRAGYEIGSVEFLRRVPVDMAGGTIEFSGKEILTFFKVRDFAEYRFKDMVEKIKEVYEAKEYPNYFELYYSQFSRECGYDVLIVGGFENWAFFDNKPDFKADFEEIHGEGSFQQLVEEYRDVVEGEYDELIMYVPELSADPAE